MESSLRFWKSSWVPSASRFLFNTKDSAIWIDAFDDTWGGRESSLLSSSMSSAEERWIKMGLKSSCATLLTLSSTQGRNLELSVNTGVKVLCKVSSICRTRPFVNKGSRLDSDTCCLISRQHKNESCFLSWIFSSKAVTTGDWWQFAVVSCLCW